MGLLLDPFLKIVMFECNCVICMYSKYILNKYLHGVGIIHHITGNHLPVYSSDGSGMNPF